MADATDDFNRAGPGLGSNWTAGLDSIVINGSINITGGSAADASAWWNANSFGSDQYAEVRKVNALDGGGGLVRHQSGANTFYAFSSFNASQAIIWEVTAGTFAQLGAAFTGTYTNTHTIRIDATGSTLTAINDGSSLGTRSDSSITGGAPGVHMSGSSTRNDDWIGGPISTAAPFVGGEFPDEIASLLRRDRYGVAMRTPDVRADRLLNLLKSQDKFFGAAGDGPNYDWPNPRGKPFPSDLRGFTDSFNLTLIGKDQFFGAAGDGPNYDWPNPQLGKPFPKDLRGFVNGTDLLLLGKDTFFSAPGQGPDYDWPNPRGRPFPKDLLGFLSSTNVPLLSVAVPFSQDVWPNPMRPYVPVEWRFLNLHATTLSLNAPAPDRFARPPLYGGIVVRPRSNDSGTWFVNLLASTLAPSAAVPFNQTDWANPRSKPFSIDLRGFIDPFNPNLVGQDTFFGAAGQPPANLDWPNPKLPLPRDRTMPSPYLMGTTFTTLPAPFRQNDWQNPRGSPYAISLRTHIDPLKLNLQGQDQFFGAPGQPPAHEWTVPRGRAPLTAYGVWSINLLETTLATPFRPQAWDNPPRAGARRIDTWSVDLLGTTLATVQATPFFGSSSPNPQQRARRVEPLFTDQLRLTLRGVAAAKPFFQLDWPNPTRRRRATQQYLITEPFQPPLPIFLIEGGGIFIGDALAPDYPAGGDANLFEVEGEGLAGGGGAGVRALAADGIDPLLRFPGLAFLAAASGFGSAVQSGGVEIKYRVGPLIETLPNANARITEDGYYRITEDGIPRVTN